MSKNIKFTISDLDKYFGTEKQKIKTKKFNINNVRRHMALKKINSDKEKEIYINGIIDSLLNFKAYHARASGGKGYSYQDYLNEMKNTGVIPTNDLELLIEVRFGESEDKQNDIEYKLVKIVTLYKILKNWPNLIDIRSQSNDKLKTLLKRVRLTLQEYMPDYSITFDDNGNFKSYKPIEENSVVENLNDIPQDISDPIKELLKPMINENEAIGLISKIYSKFEKIKKDSLKNLNETDKGIYQRARDLAMMVANKVDMAKGHKGDSSLSIKDISHNFALNASLVQKLININNKD